MVTTKQKLLLAALIGAAGMPLTGSPAAAVSLREAIAAAVQNNPQIEEAAANRRAVDEELNQARGLYLPRLDLEASGGYLYNHRPKAGINNDSRWGDQAGLVTRYTLFDGGFRHAEVDKQAARVVGAAVRVRERSELIALETLQTYLDLGRFQSILRLSEENLRIHRDLVGLVEIRFNGGTSTEGEVFLARERLLAAEAIRADVKRTLGAAEARYINLVGRRHASLDPVSSPKSLPGSRDIAIRKARADNPTLQAIDRDVAAARAELKQSEAAFRPNVALEGRGNVGHDLNAIPGANHDASAKVVMSWNLFNGHIDQARRREKAERLAEVESRLDRLRRDIDEAVMRSWSDIKTNDERKDVLSRQIAAGSKLNSAYRQEFEAGRRSMLDLLEAQNVHFNARVQGITANSLSLFARYQLIAATGGLLDQFGIGTKDEAGEHLQPWNRDHHERPSLHPLLRR
jgi:outer membrane protein, adhesin transport system